MNNEIQLKISDYRESCPESGLIVGFLDKAKDQFHRNDLMDWFLNLIGECATSDRDLLGLYWHQEQIDSYFEYKRLSGLEGALPVLLIVYDIAYGTFLYRLIPIDDLDYAAAISCQGRPNIDPYISPDQFEFVKSIREKNAKMKPAINSVALSDPSIVITMAI